MTSFFRFVNKRAIYRLGIISLAHAMVHVTDFLVVNVHVNELWTSEWTLFRTCKTQFLPVRMDKLGKKKLLVQTV